MNNKYDSGLLLHEDAQQQSGKPQDSWKTVVTWSKKDFSTQLPEHRLSFRPNRKTKRARSESSQIRLKINTTQTKF